MNICFVCREYPPAPRTGGIGSATGDLGRALVRLGHQVHVVAHAWPAPGTSSDEGVLVHRIRPPRWRLPGLARYAGQSVDRLGWSWAAARAVSRLERAEGLDLVEAPEFAAEGLMSARRRRPAVVVRLHTPLALVRAFNGAPLGADCRHTVRMERTAIRLASAVTAPSRAIAEACAAAGYGTRAGEAHILPHGIDTTVFSPGPAVFGAGAPPLVLYVGRLETRKGVGVLARALPAIARRAPRTRFAFVGADTTTAPGGRSWEDVLREGARAAGIDGRVVFVGPLSREELLAWYRAASVVVVPSPFENLAMVYLEALACGRPIVGSAAGAFPEVVTNGREGHAVAPDDPESLAGAVVGLLEDPARAQEMGRRARRRALDAFSLRAAAERTAMFYADVAAGVRSA